MNTETENLTPQQSLDLITSMINQAKGNVQRSGFYFLLWGWTIFIANLGVYVLLNYGTVENPFLMFGLTIPAAIISVIHGAKRNQQAATTTHIDSIHKWIWIAYGVTCLIMVVFGKQTNWQVNPIVITMTAAPTFISGVMIRFKPLMLGGIAFWIFGIASFMAPLDMQFLLGALAIAIGYLVPGYLLQKSSV